MNIQEGKIKVDLKRIMTRIMGALEFKTDPKARQEIIAAIKDDLEDILPKHGYILFEAEDHEVGMAMGQLNAIHKAAGELEEKIGNEEKDLPAWIQAHITSAYEYLKQANDNFHELKESDSEFFKGGIANGMSEQDLADHHNLPLSDIKRALNMGQAVEMEHTDDKEKAYEIAKDHVYEDPKYYDKLAKVEEADFYNIEPGNIGGMGPISLPGVDSVGSGDVPAGQADDDDEEDEDNRNVLSFEAFVNELHQIKPFEPERPGGEKLGEDDYEPGPANDPDAEMRERMKTLKKARGVISFKDFNPI